MKKIFAFLICLALCISPMRLYASSAEDTSYISVSFNPGEQKLTVEGRSDLAPASPIVVHLVSGTDQLPSEDNPPVVFDMVFTDDGGFFTSELIIPANVGNGVYTVFVGDESRDTAYTENIIIYLENSSATRDALKALNNSSDYSQLQSVLENYGTDLGINMDEQKNPVAFSKVLYGVKKSEGGFTLDEFAEAVSFAKGAVVLINEENVVLVMRNHASAFDYSNQLYEALDGDVRLKADSILLETDMYSGYVSYKEAVMVAKVSLTKSYGELKELLLSDPSVYGIDIDGKYDRLSKNNKSNVFKIMFDKRDGFKSLEDLTDAFDKAVFSLLADKTGEGSSSGGDSRNHSGASTVVGGTPTVPVVTVNLPYSDIESNFAKENIVNLSNLGIINGYSDGTFKPGNVVTRAEFCKIVCTAFGFSGESSQGFADVSEDDWYYEYTGIMYNLGMIRGDGTNFYPQNPITRQDAAVIIKNALNVMKKSLDGDYNFADSAQIADYAKNAVGSLAGNGYLKGDGTNFYPLANITRAEVAAVIDRIYTSIH